ncbi:SO_0444 family Cu/Zn efflux transporter [Vibrio sp.]|nr:SO_0444 family Cu/Zn efflux transporter [Vibrio sp.]
MTLLTNFIELFLSAAPWLLFGYFIAALMKEFLPASFMSKHLGDNSFSTVVKAALIGAPLPLCSCGVIPAALGLRRSGASKSATASFLVATPETGVDSVAVSYAMLGPLMAIVRPIAAICSAIGAGFLVSQIDDKESENKTSSTEKAPSSCCASKKAKIEEKPTSSCCASKKPVSTLSSRAKGIWNYAMHKLISDTYKWLLIGIVFAALIQTYVPKELFIEWGDGWAAMIFMTVIGIPMYICATASTPIAAGFLLAGVSPGATLVFLLAGPATNIATLALVKIELGKKALAGYLGGVVGGAWLFGWGLDTLMEWNEWTIQPNSWAEHDVLYSFPILALSLVLAVYMGKAMTTDLQKKFA